MRQAREETPVKVLVASNMYPGPHGPFYGAFIERHVERLRHDPRFAIELAKIDDPRKGFGRSSFKYARFFAALARAGARFRPHVIHYHYALPTALLAPLHGSTPYVVTVHGGDFYEIPERLPLGRVLLRKVLGGARRIITVSEALRRDLESFLPEVSERLSVIDMGVDIKAFAPPTDPAPLSRFAYVGQLIHRKGVDLLVAAMAHLNDASLTLIGDGPLRGELEAMARPLGHRVRFLGALPPSEVPSVLREHGVLVVPSRREPLGLVALEGMAAGLVVVAARVDGLAELVHEGTNGRTFAPEDVGALTRTLGQVQKLDMPGRRALLRAGMATARAHSLEHQVEAVAEALLTAARR